MKIATITDIKSVLNAQELIYAAASTIVGRLFEGHTASYIDIIDVMPEGSNVRLQSRLMYQGGDYQSDTITIPSWVLIKEISIIEKAQGAEDLAIKTGMTV